MGAVSKIRFCLTLHKDKSGGGGGASVGKERSQKGVLGHF